MKKTLLQLLLTMPFFVTAFLSINAQTQENLDIAKIETTTKIAQTENSTAEKLKIESLRKSVYRNTQMSEEPAQIAQNQSGYVRPTAEKRFKRFANNTVGISGLIGATIGASIGTAANNPPDWKRNGKGFARRFASNFGENAIQETVAYGMEEALKLDSKFYKSKKKDFGSRLKNALLAEFTARTPSGKRVFNPARVVGTYTANVISNEVWYPKRFSYKDGLRQGTQSIGFTIGLNILREFLFK